MSFDHEALHGTQADESTLAGRTYSYSRRRWNAFDAWQDHVRKAGANTKAAADTLATAFSVRHDRDLRRATVPGGRTAAEPIRTQGPWGGKLRPMRRERSCVHS